MAESPETVDITIEERRQSQVSDIQMNVEALMARDVDVLELDPPMAYDAVRFISPTDLVSKYYRSPLGQVTDRRWNEIAQQRGGYPEIRYLNFKDPFKITLNPRTSVTFVLWFPYDYDADRTFTTAEGIEFTQNQGQVSNSLRPDDSSIDALTSAWVDRTMIGQVINLIEGDYIDWNGTTFTIKSQGQIVVQRSEWIVKENVAVEGDDSVLADRLVPMKIPFDDYGLNVATIDAAYAVPSQEQQGSSGLLDDPLTPDVCLLYTSDAADE